MKSNVDILKYRDYFNSIAGARVRERKRHAYYWNDITRYINYFSHPDDHVLEIGCGTGELLDQIKGATKTGIDYSPKMIEIARKNYPGIHFIEMAGENVKLDKKFDLVILSNLIGFTDDIQLLFEALKAVCHERTKIIITYYNKGWEPFLKFAEFLGFKGKTPVQNWLSMADIKNLLWLAGFEVYRENKRMLIPFNIPLISWFFNVFLAKMPLINSFCLNSFTFAKPLNEIDESTVADKYSISIIIPARNESGNIENGLLRIPSFGKSQEIIFIEGNSTDDTWEKIKDVKSRYDNRKNIVIGKQPGKGKYDAVRTGFNLATGDILMILDADLTVPPEDLGKFYNALATNKGDFINGCRLIYQMDKQAMRFLNMLGNKFFGMTFSWLLQQSFKDTLCGTKVLFRSDYKKLEKNRAYFGDFDPFGDFDLLFGAFKLNLKIVELPIRYRERTYGETNISRFKHGLILLKMCIFACKKIKFI